MTTPKTERVSIGRWLRPTMLGPALSTYGAVGLYAAFGGHDGFARWAILILGLLLGTLWTAIYTLMLALIDVALLGLKVRGLPHGKRGWGLSAGSPLACFLVYLVLPPASFYKFGPWAVAAAVFVPMLVVGALSRFFGGEKTDAQKQRK
jgi:hypothetical protein